MKKLGALVIAILLYTAIVFYFGWSVFTWFTNMVQVNPWIFGVVWALFASALIIGRIDHRLRLFQIVGSYWMIVMQYGIILFPMFTILIWIFPNQLTLIGWIIFSVFVLIILTVHIMHIHQLFVSLSINMPKKDSKLNELKIVVASDFHLGLLSNKTHLKRFVKLVQRSTARFVF